MNKPDQATCKHRYVEHEKEDNGYWFRCVYCGKKVFGSLTTKGRA